MCRKAYFKHVCIAVLLFLKHFQYSRHARAGVRVRDVGGDAGVVGGSRVRGRRAARVLVRRTAARAAPPAAPGARLARTARKVQVGRVRGQLSVG